MALEWGITLDQVNDSFMLVPPQVQVYSAATNQVKKSISRFQQIAYSGCFRNDGKLLAAGSEEGVVQVR